MVKCNLDGAPGDRAAPEHASAANAEPTNVPAMAPLLALGLLAGPVIALGAVFCALAQGQKDL